MRTRVQALSAAVAVVLSVFLTCTVPPVHASGLRSSSPIQGATSPAACSTTLACTRALLHMLNRERTSDGLRALHLKMSQSLGTSGCSGSLGHSLAMARSGSIWHVNRAYPHQSFPRNICIPHLTAGENVGEESTSDVFQALQDLNTLMMSEPHAGRTCAVTVNHACNILDGEFHHVGIGIFVSAGTTWLTEDFTN